MPPKPPIALITGASRGIGAALAHELTSRGYEVIGTSTKGGNGFLPLDLLDPSGPAALAKSLSGRAIDLLICNAGLYLDKGQSLADGYPSEMWATEFAVNVTGVFLTVQALLPALQSGDAGGKIAIISSQMASHSRAPGGSYIYRASKAAALNLGRNLATDLKSVGIAVGIYHPGWVQTDMGGMGAEISAEQSAKGLSDRFAALSLTTTGCFETWDGRAHAY
ncbi:MULTISPECIES: SDR family NAD(P)-dependent oxidoreductase [Roseobacteraceae]|jgi:NAD(P)-dependent dehydrogenase (short-subunit alcohol dehydrogenase family)|uniref:SDR family NAD(P)-dependent oxidoreductase n=1 Tax=Roseobacteraceae TaxID=2854170 RepID=UPI00125F15F0|nr:MULTISPECIES: SDR family NAD(P)-dependent oxidoreductase [Roseobacteraceae]KAB6717594.1 short-chain dehydrogenase [Roseobacter sp. TSBP12]|tara:strand:- start:2402 stop:3067 length:666 start_codon:yes stop_codon:yes gene_type:complete